MPIADAAATLFYGRLFDLDPKLETLFKGDMVEQGRKLMQMLGVAVNSLDRLEQVLPAVNALGARHARYGVREKDYDTVGRALIWTLKRAWAKSSRRRRRPRGQRSTPRSPAR